MNRRTLSGYAIVDVSVRRTLTEKPDLFLTIDNALDRRDRSANLRAYSNPEELIGSPQAPRRVVAGVDVRLP